MRSLPVVAGCIAITILTLAIYGQVLSFDFVNYDDEYYIYHNETVKKGITLQNVAWAFATGRQSNWHPLTWLSYMLDIQLFGANPGPMHAVSVSWHILNAIVLLLMLARITKQPGPSILVAALFALHPLHVESVAWIAERKDVLSTFFGLLAIAAYFWYAARPSAARNLLVALLLALGLMAKPMLVTWPFVLLLLDYWPLRRPLRMGLVVEKWPHFMLIVASAIVTYAVQRAGGAVTSLESTPLIWRVQNAVVAYVVYLGKTFWPAHLAVLYPFPEEPYPIATVAGACAILVVITAIVLRFAKSRPYLPVGWFWYLGTLVPVIGIVRVGEQAYADRYTYIPLIGIFITLAWLAADVVNSRPHLRIAAWAIGSAAVVALTFAAYAQARVWRDNFHLYEHALAVTPYNPTVRYNYGNALLEAGRYAEAEEQFRIAASTRADNREELTNVGVALLEQGRLNDAEQAFRAVLDRYPDHVEAYINLGVVAMRRERWDDALQRFEQARRTAPEDPNVNLYLGITFAALERWADAEAILRKTAEMQPDDYRTLYHWGRALLRTGDPRAAAEILHRATQQEPTNASTWYQLGNAYLASGQWPDAQSAFEQCLQHDSGNAAAEVNLGIVFASQQEFSTAIDHFRRAIVLNPESADAHFNLALALQLTGDIDASKRHVQEALRLNPNDARARQLNAQLESKVAN